MNRSVTIADVQTDVDDLSDQEKYMLGHIDDLSARINETTTMLAQLHAAREHFSGDLIRSRAQLAVNRTVAESGGAAI